MDYSSNGTCFSRRYAMAFSIKDEKADRIARRLTRMTGESLTTAVRVALEERLERERRRRARDERIKRILAISDRALRDMKHPAHSLDHADLLYDEDGLPR